LKKLEWLVINASEQELRRDYNTIPNLYLYKQEFPVKVIGRRMFFGSWFEVVKYDNNVIQLASVQSVLKDSNNFYVVNVGFETSLRGLARALDLNYEEKRKDLKITFDMLLSEGGVEAHTKSFIKNSETINYYIYSGTFPNVWTCLPSIEQAIVDKRTRKARRKGPRSRDLRELLV